MKRVKLVVAYDGTNYHGWQLQPNGVSIEEVLNRTLSELLREPIQVIGASRTDSGVHALGSVAVFDTGNRMPAEKICFALNQRLPEDIRIQSSEEVPLTWHPRKQNCVKTYEYKIMNRKIDMPVGRLYTYFCYFPMDVEKMRQAAAYLIGEHDFKSFCTVRTQAEETVRTIYALTVERGSDDVVTIRISGSGFLYNMVRIIAGTLLRVGTGLYAPEHVEEILDAKDRQAAGPTLPAKGLTLISLEYEKELTPEIRGTNKYWDYLLIQREIPEKKKAYLVIRRCVENEFHRLVTRVVHQAARNGAKWIYVVDKEGEASSASSRIQDGEAFGYYEMKRSHCFWNMEKRVEAAEGQTPEDWALEAPASEGRAMEEPASEGRAMEAPVSGTQSSEDMEPEKRKAVHLEPLQAGEVQSWIQMQNETFFFTVNSGTYETGMVKEEQEAGSRFFWICDGETKVGTLILIPKEDSLFIDGIAVSSRYQGRGYGRAALECCGRMAAGLGMGTLSLIVADSNLHAKNLYERTGFVCTGRGPEWFCTESSLMQ